MQIITPATITWTQDHKPFADDFGDYYFSNENGLEETQHVFINGNQLAERWKSLQENSFVIGETGFGTGLNFIAAWQLWSSLLLNNSALRHAHLTFVSAELHPLRKTDLIKAAHAWPELKPFYDQLIEQYPTLTPGFHTLQFDSVTLRLMLGDATDMFDALLESDHPDFYHTLNGKIDCWFLDGFAPSKNPTLWSDALINKLACLSKPETTLATFSVAGQMRRALEAAGFSVQKKVGFGNKREMVTASFTPHTKTDSMKDKPSFISSPYVAPWYLIKGKQTKTNQTKKRNDVSIIGAGIAGCTLANALAQKGFDVTVFDEQSNPATQASGNQQAILYSKFSATDDDFAQFNLASYVYALRYYQQLLKKNPNLPIYLCGLLQLAVSEKEQVVQSALADFFSHYPDFATKVTREQASELAGVRVETGGLFFSQAGWINPAAVCEQLLQHPNITRVFNKRITALNYDDKKYQWHLSDNTNNLITSSQNTFTHVVITNGHQCQQFEQSNALPLKFIRGQVTHARATKLSSQLKTVLCGDGYIAPAISDSHSFGATYTPKVTEFTLTDAEHKTNIENLALSSRALSDEWSIDKGITGGRAHVRTATPDYFPLCGPLPNHKDFLQTYALLRKNANANIPEAGSYYPNLYIFSGLGSRGMSYAPLCAEVLSNQISGAPLVLPRSIVQQLNPARFVIRDLIKNRV